MTSGWKIALAMVNALVLLFTVDYVIGRVIHRRGRHRARAGWRDRLADLPVTLRHLDDEPFEGDYQDGLDVIEAVEAATQDMPQPGQVPDHGPAVTRGDTGLRQPDYHDDAPTDAIPTIRIGGAYVPNLGYDPADVPRPIPDSAPAEAGRAGPGHPFQPHAGPSAWEPARPNPRVPCAPALTKWEQYELAGVPEGLRYVQIAMKAPTKDAALADIVAMSRIRALAAA